LGGRCVGLCFPRVRVGLVKFLSSIVTWTRSLVYRLLLAEDVTRSPWHLVGIGFVVNCVASCLYNVAFWYNCLGLSYKKYMIYTFQGCILEKKTLQNSLF
jgi:hypothetical protein